MRKAAILFTLLFLMPLLSIGQVRAEADIGLEEAGITMVALRNDTLDLNPVSYTHLTLPTILRV